MTKLLIISNNFAGSRVHSCLSKELAAIGYEQEIFTYINEDKVGLTNNQFESPNVSFHYQFIITKWDHRMYYKKIHKVAKECERVVNLNKIGVIQATTLFSDGGVAYLLSKKYTVPYTIAVRSADLYPFLKYGFHTWPLCKKILLNASRIFFISDSLKRNFSENRFIRSFLPLIKDKFIVQPNGVDSFWHENINTIKHGSEEHSVLYVGVFDHIKNVLGLIDAVLFLKEKYPDIRLNLVGGRGSKKEDVARIVNKYPDIIKYYGEVKDKNLLMDFYRENSILAMPSFYETFGLTYIEALSQNCAIIFSERQGVDGMVPDNAGISVNPKSVQSIASAIDTIFTNRNYYSNESVNFSTFDWKKIGATYYKQFQEISR